MYLTDYTKIYWHILHNICTTQANTFNMSHKHTENVLHSDYFMSKNVNRIHLLTIITYNEILEGEAVFG